MDGVLYVGGSYVPMLSRLSFDRHFACIVHAVDDAFCLEGTMLAAGVERIYRGAAQPPGFIIVGGGA